MPSFGLLRNNSRTNQSWGNWEIAAGGIGRVPYEIIEGLRKHPSRDFEVIDDQSESYPFVRTEHEPFNTRYKR
jgi:hypothetical protein